MTIRYVGFGGNNSNNGLTWATRKLTLNGAEDSPVVAGDKVYVGGGTYRELLTTDVSGSLLVTGSSSVVAFVTNGSPVVIVSGTSLITAGVGFDDVFQTPALASGMDGVTTNITGTSHVFTSASGNFQQGHVGNTIRISTNGAYVIRVVNSSTSINISKSDNSSFGMAAGTGLTYNVGAESPYDILRVDNSSQLTLASSWGAPSLGGLGFIIYRPIRYVADYTGANTDGIGGVVRITGSNDDITNTRNQCIACDESYRVFRGFSMDMVVQQVILLSNCKNDTIEKCKLNTATQAAIAMNGALQANHTVRNCFFEGGANIGITHTSTVDNAGHVVENTIAPMGSNPVQFLAIDRVGGVTCRNNLVNSYIRAFRVNAALAVGQALTVNNCIILYCSEAFRATVSGELIEDYNNLFANGTNRVNTATGANTLAYNPILDARWFFQITHEGAGPYSPLQMVSPFDLSSQSRIINVTGTNPAPTDMRGTDIQNTQREWGALEFDSTLSTKARQSGMVDGGMIIS